MASMSLVAAVAEVEGVGDPVVILEDLLIRRATVAAVTVVLIGSLFFFINSLLLLFRAPLPLLLMLLLLLVSLTGFDADTEETGFFVGDLEDIVAVVAADSLLDRSFLSISLWFSSMTPAAGTTFEAGPFF